MKKALYDSGNAFLKLTNSQKEKINFLKNLFNPYTNKVYIVGGTLRNYFLNEKNNNDIDIEVHGIDIKLFEKLMENIDASGVGKSFFVYKWNNIDISLPRIESKTSYGHKGFEVKLALNEKQASIRRDFTMNALMYNIYTNELLDYYNGIDDINNKSINIVNETSFKEDSLRVLRAIRFSSTYNLKITKNSLNIMKNMDISDLSKHRINEELKQIFRSNYLELALYYLIKTNIFYKLFNKNINFKEFIFLYKYIKKNKQYFNENLKEYYFLFILKKYLNISFDNLNLSNRYKFINNEIYLDNISDEDLLYLASIKPINEYLDASKLNIINKSKKLNIYTKILNLKIDIQKIIKDGFKNEEIKKEIIKRKKIIIKNMIFNN